MGHWRWTPSAVSTVWGNLQDETSSICHELKGCAALNRRVAFQLLLLMSHSTEIRLYGKQMAPQQHNGAVKRPTMFHWLHFLHDPHQHEPQSPGGSVSTDIPGTEPQWQRHSDECRKQGYVDNHVTGWEEISTHLFPPVMCQDFQLMLAPANMNWIGLRPPADLVSGLTFDEGLKGLQKTKRRVVLEKSFRRRYY